MTSGPLPPVPTSTSDVPADTRDFSAEETWNGPDSARLRDLDIRTRARHHLDRAGEFAKSAQEHQSKANEHAHFAQEKRDQEEACLQDLAKRLLALIALELEVEPEWLSALMARTTTREDIPF